jgi:hypothetical protein
MRIWLEKNVQAILVGAGLGIFIGEFLLPFPFAWIASGLAGVAIALPIWQVNQDKWRREPRSHATNGLGERAASPYYRVMEQPRPAQELASLRDFLRRLESNELSLRRKGIDVTHEEVAVLKREIDHLDGILARAKSRDQNALAPKP